MNSQAIKKPLSAHFGEDTDKGSDTRENFTKRIARYGEAHSRSREMVAHLRSLKGKGSPVPEFERHKLEVAINDCGNYLVFRDYFTVNQVKLTKASFCKKHHLCPLCAIRRGAKQVKAYTDKYLTILESSPDIRASLLTLTVKNGDDLAERFDHLQKSVKRLTKKRTRALTGGRHKTEFSKIHGAVGTYEITNKGNGWHPHTHLIILHTDPIDQDALSEEWKNITKDSFVVDVRPLQNPGDPGADFVEVFKYAIKFSDLTLADNLLAYSILKGRRLVYSFGLFWGVKVPEHLTDDELHDLPYIEMLFLYLGDGYHQTSCSPPRIDLAVEERAG